MASSGKKTRLRSGIARVARLKRAGAIDRSNDLKLLIHVAPDAEDAKGGSGKAIKRLGKSTTNIREVADLLKSEGVTIVRRRPRLSLLEVSAPPSVVEKALGVTLVSVEEKGRRHRAYEGEVKLPPELEDKVLSVMGLDNLRLVEHSGEDLWQTKLCTDPYTPQELAERYDFPTDNAGAGTTIALVLLDGGFYQSDVDAYFASVGLKVPKITVIGPNNPAPKEDTAAVVKAFASESAPPAGTMTSQVMWTIETTMDVQLAGALANDAELIVAFAEDNSISGATAVLTELLELSTPPTVVCISWSFNESDRSESDLAAFDRVLEELTEGGTTICACTGDYGSSGKSENIAKGELAVVYPASSHFALACGGTTLPRSTVAKGTEAVWNTTQDHPGSPAEAAVRMASGGGFSNIYERPSWQSSATKAYAGSMRGLPDVSANADPATGTCILVAGEAYVSAGTSAAAPTWGALVARMVSSLGSNLGHLGPRLYELYAEPAITVVGEGANCLAANSRDWTAAQGWSPAVGLGSPRGTALLEALRRS